MILLNCEIQSSVTSYVYVCAYACYCYCDCERYCRGPILKDHIDWFSLYRSMLKFTILYPNDHCAYATGAIYAWTVVNVEDTM